MFDWGDLPAFLAVARHGSTIAAARALKVDQSTIQRRIASLERRLGAALVHRDPAGYTLTEFGRTLLPVAEAMAEAAEAVVREATAHARDLAGVIRLTCPEPLVLRLAGSPLLKLFAERHPTLAIEFVMSDRYVDLAGGEADVALRSGTPDDDSLVGRRVGDSVWAVYASRAYIARYGQPASESDISDHAVIGFEIALAQHRAARWLAEVAPKAVVAARHSSVLGVLHAVKSGIGLAPLPTTIADMHEDLVQVLPPVAALDRGWYLLAHPVMRRTRRVSAFFDFVIENIALLRPLLMG